MTLVEQDFGMRAQFAARRNLVGQAHVLGGKAQQALPDGAVQFGGAGSMVGDFVKLAGGKEADAHAELTRGVPMKRVAEVDEVVEVILFAADPKNSFMTGHTLSVDGGIMAI